MELLKRFRSKAERPARAVEMAGHYSRPNRELDPIVKRLVASVDPAGFAALKARHEPLLAPHPGPGKYLDMATWMRRHLIHARALGLIDGPSRRVLDLGTGAAYFPYLLGQLGHTAKAIDLDDIPAYNDLIVLLGVDRRTHRVRSGEPLPDFGMRFDWVTGFNIMFNLNNHPEMWNPPEWREFLRHLALDLLAPEGQAFFKLNPIRLEGYDTDGLLGFFESLGASVAFPFVHFPSREKLV